MGKSLVSWFLTHGVEYFLIGYVCVLNCCSDRSLLTLFLLFVIVVRTAAFHLIFVAHTNMFRFVGFGEQCWTELPWRC